ncbi:MAG: hypothetical protein ACP5U2_07465 [Bryobacteraceae bacterium]
MRIGINLASEPFRPRRPVIVAAAMMAGLLLAVLATLAYLGVQERARLSATREAVARLEDEARALTAEQARLEALLRRAENAEVLEHSLFYNSLLYRRGISWTRLFDDLEQVIPHNVRLISIRPQLGAENEVLLDMVVGAESSEPVVALLARLENSPRFGQTHVHNRIPPSQSEPLLRYRISVRYEQKL